MKDQKRLDRIDELREAADFLAAGLEEDGSKPPSTSTSTSTSRDPKK